MKRWFYGWAMWWRAIKMTRAKKHGAGKLAWKYAFRMGASYRWLVDGQMRGGRPPRWMNR